MKILFTFFFLLVFVFSNAQNIDRITVKGVILVSETADVDGVCIYNTSSQKGTITDADGNFTIALAENDRLYVSALQFQNFTVIIDHGVIASKRIKIIVNPAVTQLEEVVINQYDLTGNVVVDAQNIKTHVIPNIQLSLRDVMSNSNMLPDRYSSIKGNFAESVLLPTTDGVSVNFVKLAELLFPKKYNKILQPRKGNINVMQVLRDRFTSTFLAEKFEIATENSDGFLYYLTDNGLLESYLRPENEILLLDFLRQKSIAYKDYLEEK